MIVRRMLQLAGFGLLVSLLYVLFKWAIWHAVFTADPLACRALSHQGACWGVIAEKASPMLWGHFAHTGQLGGLPLTVVLFVSSLALSFPLAVALALARRSTWRWLSVPAVLVIELIRGVPLVTLLFMAAFLLPVLLPAGWQPAMVWRAGLALTLFSTVYLAEIVRGGLQTVPTEQSEAGAILGLTWWQIQGRIVLPQALKAVLPAMVGHAIGLLKDSSLVMVVGLHELTGGLSLSLGGDPIWRPFYLEAYLFVGAIYALMCWALSRTGTWLEAHWPPPAK
jgi:general L-amino acid transport system permease protein